MPALGAHTFAGYATDTTTTTPAITLQSTATVMVCGYWQQTSTPPTITDSNGNTLTLVSTAQVGNNSGGNWYGVWVGSGIVGGSGYTVTATKANGYTSLWVVEVIGATAYTSAFLVDATNPFSHDITTAGDALVVGFCAAEGNAALTLDSTANGFVELDEVGDFSFWQGVTAYKAVAAGTHTFSTTVTGSVLNGGVALLAFTGPAAAWRNSVAKLKVAGTFVNVLVREKIAGTFVTGTNKGFK